MFNDFDTIIRTIGEVPPVPDVAAKVMQLLENPLCSIRSLAAAISHDPGITARILKVANSVYYQQQQKVTTLERALVVLGEGFVRNLVFDSCLRSVGASFAPLQKRLWENSIGCAIAARLIAQRTRAVADPEEAFLAGLFRHLGKSVMANRHLLLYRQVVEIVDRREGHLLDVERAFFAYSHEKVGAALLQNWNFPRHLVQSTLHHHDLDIPPEHEPALLRLCAVVRLAGAICCRLGIGQTACDERDLQQTDAARALGLSGQAIEEILADFRGSFLRERKFFNVA